MSNTRLILVLLLTLGGLLFLIIRLRLQAFIALLIASIGLGLGVGFAPQKILEAVQNGMASTLGFIAIVVGLGAILGQMLEYSNGAERLARSLLDWFGIERASWALMLAGFLVAIPVFADVGMVILFPLVHRLSRDSNKSVLYYGIPLVAGLGTTHTFVPPTPGPVAVAQILNADLGKVIFWGIVLGLLPAVVAGPVWGQWIGKRIVVSPPEMFVSQQEGSGKDRSLPGLSVVLLVLLLPIVLILLNTLGNLAWPGTRVGRLLGFVGHPFAALTLAVLSSYFFLGVRRGLSRQKMLELSTSALAPAGLIILITGAGGSLKQVLVDSGAGKQLADMVRQWDLSPFLLAYLLAVVVRLAQGSATVAMITSAGFMAPVLHLNPQLDPALMTVAIASGASICSHVNDSGFWIVNRYMGLSTVQTFQSWSVASTLISIVGFAGVMVAKMLVT